MKEREKRPFGLSKKEIRKINRDAPRDYESWINYYFETFKELERGEDAKREI